MNEVYTTGAWRPKPGREQEFVDAWTAFAGWAAGMLGAGTLRLTRDGGDPRRYVSLGRWQSEEAVRAWKSSPEFRERIGRVLQHVDGFEPAELTVVATAGREASAGLTEAGGQR
jgi:heme-degrading monooxygenase HmoA